MRYQFEERDFEGGRVAFVRDVYGTRVAIRHIPRGHRVVLVGAVTVDSDGAFWTLAAGESVELGDAAMGKLLTAWQEITSTVAEANGYRVNGVIMGPYEHNEGCGHNE